MKKCNFFRMYALLGTFLLFSTNSLIAQNASSDESDNRSTDDSTFGHIVDNDNNNTVDRFRWWNNGGHAFSDLMMELRSESGNKFLEIPTTSKNAIFSLIANDNKSSRTDEETHPFIFLQAGDARSSIFYDKNNFLSFSINPKAPTNTHTFSYSEGFRFIDSNGTDIISNPTSYGTELMRIGKNGKVNIGPGNVPSTLKLQVIGNDSEGGSLGLGAQANTWDHFYLTTGNTSTVFRAGGAEDGIDFQIGTASTGTFGDASQNYTSKFQIYPNKIETKTQEVTFNYGSSTDLTKVSINTDKKVDHAALTVAGAAYIGPKAELAATGTLDKFNPDYLAKYNLWVENGIVTQDLAFASVNNWKDEVFGENYDLKSIEEVQAFIKKNKHLPEVPSEAEIKQKGYTAHQMNLIFMQKIEELTLYTINMNEKLKLLEEEIARLKTVNNNKKE